MKRFYLPNEIKATNNKVTTFFITAVMLVNTVVLVQSCKKDPPEEEEKDKPVITSVKPPSAEVGGTITINGQYFAEVASENIVKIADEIADVISGNTSSIQVTVPDGVAVGSAVVKVTANGLTSDDYIGFSVSETLPELVINSYTEEGSYGDLITITGSGFVDESKVIVTINDVLQDSALTVTDTKITFILKEKTFSGDFVLNRAGTKRTLCSFVNHLSFEVTNFKEVIAYWMAVDPITNDVYCSGIDGELYKIKNSDKSVHMIYNNSDISFSAGLFIDTTNTLYNADAKGRLIQIQLDNGIVDTLIGTNQDIELKRNKIWDLTGDNNGFLFASTNDVSILKIDLSESDATLLYKTDESTYSIATDGTKIYVVYGDQSIFIGNIDGSEPTQIIDTPVSGNSAHVCLLHNQDLGLLATNGIEAGDLSLISDNNEFKQLISAEEIGLGTEIISIAMYSNGNILIGGLEKIVMITVR